MIDPREFRNALGRFATGIAVVTMKQVTGKQGEAIHGITVNAFMSVSLEPPLVAICIDKRANAHQTLLESDRFGVSVLRHDQEALSNHFAGRPVAGVTDPFVEMAGFPLIGDALARLVCRIIAVHEAGDHSLFIGQVEQLSYDDGAPLLYYAGKYAHVQEMELSE